MGNIFGDIYSKTLGGLGDDAGKILDPHGYDEKKKQDDEDEENRRKRLEADRDKLNSQLNSKIRDVMNLHATPLATASDLKDAARRNLAQQRSRKGRESTILTGDLLGGGVG